jgi:hypothetical protein
VAQPLHGLAENSTPNNLLRQSAPLLDECRQLIAILVTISKRGRAKTNKPFAFLLLPS